MYIYIYIYIYIIQLLLYIHTIIVFQVSAEVTFHKGALSVFPLGRPLGHLKTSCQTRFYVAIHDIQSIEHINIHVSKPITLHRSIHVFMDGGQTTAQLHCMWRRCRLHCAARAEFSVQFFSYYQFLLVMVAFIYMYIYTHIYVYIYIYV